MSRMEPTVWFKGENTESLAREVEQFLGKDPRFEFSMILFCVDGLLSDCLEDQVPRYILFGKKRVPRTLFKSPEFFDLERCRRGDWMHLKVYGVLDGAALIGVQSPIESPYIPAEPVRIRLTQCDSVPRWTFGANRNLGDLSE